VLRRQAGLIRAVRFETRMSPCPPPKSALSPTLRCTADDRSGSSAAHSCCWRRVRSTSDRYGPARGNEGGREEQRPVRDTWCRGPCHLRAIHLLFNRKMLQCAMNSFFGKGNMSSITAITKRRPFRDAVDFSTILVVLSWAALVTIAGYFILTDVPRYFVWSEASYRAYFWPRAAFLFPHVLGGLVALVIGPFQFWARIRNGYPKIHRIGGRIYLISVLVGALFGMAMALISSRGLTFGSGLFALAVAWLLTSGMAFISIHKRNFVQHKQWMVRSYVVTFAFVTSRVLINLLGYYGIGQRTDRLSLVSWAGWAVPLLVTELVLQSKQVFTAGARQTA
jgi:hypothetical protein